MKRLCVILAWVWANAAFAADDAALQARIDAARAKLDAAAKELAALYGQDTFHIQVPSPGSQVSLGALLMPGGQGGVNVAGVTPDGPADRAGIVAGDILVSINSTALDGAADKPPIARLFDALAKVAPGDAVRIDYLHDAERLTTDVIADPPRPLPPGVGTGVAGGNVAYGAVAAPDSGPTTLAIASNLDGSQRTSVRAMIGGLELFDLDAALGHYFGVDNGVLVLRAPKGTELVAGDVVRSIDGTAVNAVPQCLSALARTQGSVSMEVLRDGAVQVVQYTPPPGGPNLLPLPPPGARVMVAPNRPTASEPSTTSQPSTTLQP